MNGFILDSVTKFVLFMQKISLVEWYKNYCNKKCSGQNSTEIITCMNNAIDRFIIFKWLFIASLVLFDASNSILHIIVIYLLVMNIHTYLFYHLWSDYSYANRIRDINHKRRRFVVLLQSFGFNCLSFSYFYSLSNVFSVHTNFSEKYTQKSMAFMHSIYSSFTSVSPYIEPISFLGFVIQVLHVITTFIFLSILLSRVDT